MRTVIGLVFLIALLGIAACGGGDDTLTGKAVSDASSADSGSADDSASPEGSADETAGQGESDSSEDTGEEEENSEVPEDLPPDPEEDSPIADVDAEQPDYSAYAGECIEGSDDAVRVIDEKGVKKVHRNECFGDKLVDYRCEGNELDSELKVCPDGCVMERYEGRCK